MPNLKRKGDFFASEEGIDIRQKLVEMADDKTFNTVSTYSPNSVLYPDNKVSFVDKHMDYLNSHPQTDLYMYLANIRLMTRVRQ